MPSIPSLVLAIFAGYIIGFLIALLICAILASAFIRCEELYQEYKASTHSTATIGSVLKPRSKLLIQVRKWL